MTVAFNRVYAYAFSSSRQAERMKAFCWHMCAASMSLASGYTSKLWSNVLNDLSAKAGEHFYIVSVFSSSPGELGEFLCILELKLVAVATAGVRSSQPLTFSCESDLLTLRLRNNKDHHPWP